MSFEKLKEYPNFRTLIRRHNEEKVIDIMKYIYKENASVKEIKREFEDVEDLDIIVLFETIKKSTQSKDFK